MVLFIHLGFFVRRLLENLIIQYIYLMVLGWMDGTEKRN